MTKNAFILNFFKLYNLIWRLALPFLKRNPRLRQGFEKRISFSHLSLADLWVQAASAGEAYLAVTLLLNLKPRARLKVLVTTTTTQGRDILASGLTPDRISPNMDLTIAWFPFDMPDIIRQAVAVIAPKVLVLLETELWPGLLHGIKQKGIKIIMVNARMSTKSFGRYHKTKCLWKHLAPDLILAISDQDRQRFQKIFETSKIRTMSNMKFEAIETDPSSFRSGRDNVSDILPCPLPLTILASVRRQEEKEVLLLLKKLLASYPDQVVAIFPRHMGRLRSWEKRLSRLDLKFYLRSDLSSPITGPGVILWDVFGELKAAYAFAAVVFVGGSLKPLGGQNVIEPGIHGAVTVIGPYYEDFAWAAEDMIEKGLLLRESSWKAVARTMVTALEHPQDPKAQKALVQSHIQSKKGGTRQACHEILKAFDLWP
ncbi:MAG: 3-deoxy-D-manno-octulosonic acid transferase [Desulfobacteraceae bacterium]|nr:3-deoxy-D-manno-octulosonic acid transferase [Desulfobacteraceae bacterium]